MNFSELQKSELQKSELHFTSISTLKITCHFIIWFFFIWTSTKTWLQETFIQLETRKHRIGKKVKLEALEPQQSLVWIWSQSGSGHCDFLFIFFLFALRHRTELKHWQAQHRWHQRENSDLGQWDREGGALIKLTGQWSCSICKYTVLSVGGGFIYLF